ncbi:MAG: ABC transporter substrate-binding protein [Labilithrix sp.]|nr:ABC transporter substrate-binding protein [Labilithrix sp.]
MSIRGLLGIIVALAGSTGALLACSDDDGPSNGAGADAGVDGAVSDLDSGVTCPPVATPACNAAKCTADLGEPALCMDGACVKLKSADCPRAGGDLTGANQVLIGALLAQNGSNAASGTSRINSIELAVKEINANGGIPDPDPCKAPRTLAYVACDDANLAGDAGADSGPVEPVIDRTRAGKHLVEELKVAAVIGGSTSGNTLDIAKNTTIPAKVLQFAPSSTAISITAPTDFNASPDGTRLLWRAAPSDTVQSVVLQKIFLQVEAEVKAAGVVSPKLALVTKNDAYGKGILGAFKAGLQVNGAPIPSANFAEYEYKTSAGDADGITQAAVVAELVTFAPDIIVMAGTSEATDGIMRPFETGDPATKPIYILADGQKKPELTALVSPTDTTLPTLPAPARDALRQRIRGTQPGVVTLLAQNFFNFGYKTAYGNDSVLAYGMAGSYDITYLLAYAIAATKGGAIDGTTLAKNMAFLVGGTNQISVGTVALSKGMTAMLAGEKVDFSGASGPLDFDLTTGEAPSDYSVWCVKVDPNNQQRVFEEAAGLSYSAKDQTLVGTFNCP